MGEGFKTLPHTTSQKKGGCNEERQSKSYQVDVHSSLTVGKKIGAALEQGQAWNSACDYCSAMCQEYTLKEALHGGSHATCMRLAERNSDKKRLVAKQYVGAEQMAYGFEGAAVLASASDMLGGPPSFT